MGVKFYEKVVFFWVGCPLKFMFWISDIWFLKAVQFLVKNALEMMKIGSGDQILCRKLDYRLFGLGDP